MCITFVEKPTLHKTYRRHIVYKVFSKSNHGSRLKSPIWYNKIWELNKEETAELEIDNIEIGKSPRETIYQTKSGLYCFKNQSDAYFYRNNVICSVFYINYAYKVVKCIIPKDAEYYEQDGVIVTNKLKPIEIL